MRKFDIKSIAVGLVIGAIGVSAFFSYWETKTPVVNDTKVTANPNTAEVSTDLYGLKSAAINNAKIYFNGNEIKLSNPLVTTVKDGSSDEQLYMPSEVLEYMHFKVVWDKGNNSVNLIMNGQNSQNTQKDTEIKPDSSNNQADREAIEIIQKTGNWSYIEPYLSKMTADGIEKVVEVYNSKHQNPEEHKKASDYIKN